MRPEIKFEGKNGNYETRGDFRKNATMLRISKNVNGKWVLYVFQDHSPKGAIYSEEKTLKDAREVAEIHFGV